MAVATKSLFLTLADNFEIWSRICDNCTGSGLMCLARCSHLRSSTRATAAFIFLSGVDVDNGLCHWNDPGNILPKPYKGWNPDYKLASELSRCATSFDRALAADESVECILDQAPCMVSLSHRQHTFHSLPSALGPPCLQRDLEQLCNTGRRAGYHLWGPARPPSPATLIADFGYSLPNPGEECLVPTVFPPIAHSLERDKFIRRRFACPNDSSDDD
jgi:hypothetical protein